MNKDNYGKKIIQSRQDTRVVINGNCSERDIEAALRAIRDSNRDKGPVHRDSPQT